MFDRAIELFDEYYRRMDALTYPNFNKPAGVEMRRRLQQLDWLLRSVADREARLEAFHKPVAAAGDAHRADLERRGLAWDQAAGSEEMSRAMADYAKHIYLMDEAKTLTECFYYIAHRALVLVKAAKPAMLPLIGDVGFIGVSRVRNRLLEHYEPDGRLVVGDSFAMGSERGPVLRAVTQEGIEQVQDPGLRVNAAELATELERRLTAALDRIARMEAGHPKVEGATTDRPT